MEKMNNKSGFTLLEIIIVIIIVGVLASLALPKFFSTVEYSRSTEALTSISAIRQAMERCMVFDNNPVPCADFDQLDIGDPGLEPGAHFTYSFQNENAATGNYDIVATRNGLDGTDAQGDTITLAIVAGAGGSITKTGIGAYLNLR